MIEKSALFCLGALGFGCIELAWRGRTHWTMLLAGGLCMLALWALNERLGRWPLLARCAAGALVIADQRAGGDRDVRRHEQDQNPRRDVSGELRDFFNPSGKVGV